MAWKLFIEILSRRRVSYLGVIFISKSLHVGERRKVMECFLGHFDASRYALPPPSPRPLPPDVKGENQLSEKLLKGGQQNDYLPPPSPKERNVTNRYSWLMRLFYLS